ncbi:MAG TPA: hypothetical protein VJZ00_13330 [Thermoanaerobaculia bacterium]|nr:hypothetical protein [Thermoanaerobaculia bacterium]
MITKDARAALLAATMNFFPAAPVDLFRFLRVPAIVMTLRRTHRCSAPCGTRRRRSLRRLHVRQ